MRDTHRGDRAEGKQFRVTVDPDTDDPIATEVTLDALISAWIESCPDLVQSAVLLDVGGTVSAPKPGGSVLVERIR